MGNQLQTRLDLDIIYFNHILRFGSVNIKLSRSRLSCKRSHTVPLSIQSHRHNIKHFPYGTPKRLDTLRKHAILRENFGIVGKRLLCLHTGGMNTSRLVGTHKMIHQRCKPLPVECGNSFPPCVPSPCVLSSYHLPPSLSCGSSMWLCEQYIGNWCHF
jgi:hypothetical protein